jgi:Winged helix DNA-binding domain
MSHSAHRSLLGERIVRQGLVDRADSSPVAATARTTALQAQDNLAARLGVRARAAGVTDADVRHAIESDRSITRTWLMRGTIHLVDTADLRWLVRLIGPAIARKYRTRWRQLGLSDEVLDRCVEALPALLADGPRTRHEVRAGLAERGITLDHPDTLDKPDPYIHTHVIVHASTTGLICRGPDRGRDNTFVQLDDWVPGAPTGPSGDDALAELARRYFAAFSPATAADFTTWSGLPSSHAIDLIRDELSETDVDGRPGFRLGAVAPAQGLRLAPAFDNYLVGYRDRAAIVPPALQPRVYQGGMIRPVVLLDGAVAGTWALDRAKGHVTVTPFGRFTRATGRAVEAEVADVGRFLDRELSLELQPALD